MRWFPWRSTACNEVPMSTIYPCLGAKQPCVCPQWSMNVGDYNNTAASAEKGKSLGTGSGSGYAGTMLPRSCAQQRLEEVLPSSVPGEPGHRHMRSQVPLFQHCLQKHHEQISPGEHCAELFLAEPLPTPQGTHDHPTLWLGKWVQRAEGLAQSWRQGNATTWIQE